MHYPNVSVNDYSSVMMTGLVSGISLMSIVFVEPYIGIPNEDSNKFQSAGRSQNVLNSLRNGSDRAKLEAYICFTCGEALLSRIF
jgi:hypothetical protein